MRHSVILVATMALGLSACGDMKQAAEDGFKKEFVPSFTQECVKAATSSGIPADTLTKTCECTATELVETQSMTDLASLDMEKAMPIFEKCAVKAGLELGGPSTVEPQQGE